MMLEDEAVLAVCAKTAASVSSCNVDFLIVD